MDVQNFTFIQMGGPGGKKQSQYHSLVRSHAMQSVWERKKRRMPLKQTEHNTKSLPLRKNFVAERHTNTSDSVAHAHRRPKVPERRISSKTKLCRCSPPESISSEDSDVCHADTCSARITSLRGDTQESASAVGTLTPPHTPPSLGSPDSLNVSNVEPFGTIALNIDATTSRFIAHYFKSCSWRLCMPKRSWFSYSITDPALLHGVLSIAGAHYQLCGGKKIADAAFKHQGETMRLVRARLQDPNLAMTDATVGAVLRLCCTNLIHGSMDAWNHHIAGLETLVKLRGGARNLGQDGCLAHGIQCNIATAALLIDYKIPDHMVGWDPPDEVVARLFTFAETYSVPISRRYGESFFPLVSPYGLSQGLVDVFMALAEVAAILDNDREWEEDEQLLICEIFNAIQLQYVKLTQESAELQKPVAPAFKIQRIRECARHASLLFLACLRELPLGGTAFQVMLKKTKSLLAGTDLDGVWGGGERGGLLLWVLIMSGSVISDRIRDRKWFCQTTMKVAGKLGVHTWEEAREICRGFLWSDSTCGKTCRRYWAECCILIDHVDQEQ